MGIGGREIALHAQCHVTFKWVHAAKHAYNMESQLRSSQSSVQGPTSEAIICLKLLLRHPLRISVADGRVFIGTFVGTDQPLNILLVNTDEYRPGFKEDVGG